MSKGKGTESGEQAWFWTPEWQEGEREATREIWEGGLSPKFHSMDAVREHLSEAEGC